MQEFDAYRKSTVDTSDNVRIISLLFDGAINFIKLGRARMAEHDIAGKGLYLGKVTAIVGELSSSLNVKEGGEIARNLRRLYDFVLDRLLKANLKNDPAALDEAEKVLQTLREGWKGMERNQAAAHAAHLTSARSQGMALQA